MKLVLLAVMLHCVLWFAAARVARGEDRVPIRIHPENPKYLLFRGKPTFLLTATEHYGSVLNRPFDFRKYLDDLLDKRMTMTRTFLLFREIASANNPASTCKPRPEDYIAPWPRTGPGTALDGQPKFDLEKWNPEYFERLHAFLDAASKRGIVVELTLLSNSYAPEVWALNPLRAENNLQGSGKIEWPEYTSLKDKDVLGKQIAHVRKIVAETVKYDNVYYEICNEPGGGVAGHVTPAEVDAWQAQIAAAVRDAMRKAGSEHLVFGSEAFSYAPVFRQGLDATFDSKVFDVVNVHPLPNTILEKRPYQLGNFMSKELRLADLRDFGLSVWSRKKPVVWDEDNAATMFTDDVGWTIHRKRAWVALLSGSHYDAIDFSIQIGRETGTAEAQQKHRTWFKHLSEFFASIDFLHGAPMPTWIGNTPPHVLASTFAVEGKDYVAYLADEREVTDPSAGHEITGDVELALPGGTYDVRFFSPVSGRYFDQIRVEGGQTTVLKLPAFRQDLVVRASKVDDAPHAAHGVANRATELTFSLRKSYGDPFNNVEVDLIVTAPDGSQQRVPAFWAGGSTWRARYAAVRTGTHRWKLACSDVENPDLHGVQGTIEVEPYAGDNALYRHGFLRVASDKKHFEHADGTPFFWLADTWWMGLTKRLHWPDEFAALARDRVDKGFDVVQIVAGLYPDMPAFDERGANEAGFPWTRDYSRINPTYFDAADRRIAHLVDHGIAPCIVGGWGYHLPWLGVEKMKKHWRNLVARYGAYPGFWCIAGEGAMPYYLASDKPRDAEMQKKGWTEIAAYVRSIDPQHHPISIHPTDLSRTNVTDASVLDFEMLQTGHGDRASIGPTIALLKRSRSAQPTMPTINAEVCYEGILGTCHDDVVRIVTWVSQLGGTAGHTYGANGIWQLNRRDQPYGKSPHGGDYGHTPWDEAMKLPGSKQVGIARNVLEQFEWWRFEPHDDWAAYPKGHEALEPQWGKWIWFNEGDPTVDAPAAKRYFRKTFDLPEDVKPMRGVLWLSVDDRFDAMLNGKHVGGRRGAFDSPEPIDITSALRPGRNVLAIEAENLAAPVAANPAGLLASVRIRAADGKDISIGSDESWQASKAPLADDAADASPAKVLGAYGCAPWGRFAARPGRFGPFSAGIPAISRVIYVPEARAICITNLEPDVRYRARAIDPTSGESFEIAAISADEHGERECDKPVGMPAGGAGDWVLTLQRDP